MIVEKRGDLSFLLDIYNINSHCNTIGNLLLSICKEEDLRAALFYEYYGLKQRVGVAVIGASIPSLKSYIQVKVGSVPFFGSVPFLLKVTSPNFVLSTFILTLFKGSQKK